MTRPGQPDRGEPAVRVRNAFSLRNNAVQLRLLESHPDDVSLRRLRYADAELADR